MYEDEWKRNLMQHRITKIIIEVWKCKEPKKKCKLKEGESKEVEAIAIEVIYVDI